MSAIDTTVGSTAAPAKRQPLTPDERAEAKRAKKRARVEFDRLIFETLSQGMSSNEAGEMLELKPRRIRRHMAAIGLTTLRPNQRFIGFKLPAASAQMVRRLAQGAEITPPEMVARILSVMFADGLAPARKRLGRLALPIATKSNHSEQAK